MSHMNVTAFHGINTDSLGHYLVGLGLLRAVSSKWRDARGCWHDGFFHLAGAFTDIDVGNFISQEWQPTPYEKKWWRAAQKADTKAKTSTQLWAARSVWPLAHVRLADCTIIAASRNQFNPLFGTGGNVGKRNLEAAWSKANELRRQLESPHWLEATLFGHETIANPPFKNGGTWFAYNNKTFNSGLNWYRDGALSPWSFLLSMEGALLVRGGSGRRLGSRAKPYAVFPFVSQPLQAAGAEDVGQKAPGEFWAPLWEQPATLGEVCGLFQRGLARVGERAAAAPHEFAVAALAAGADAGLTHFIRFELRQTTSSQVYEALPRQTIAVAKPLNGPSDTSPSILLEEFLGQRWFDKLPYEPAARGSKKKFSGLRGPLERLILAVAREPESPEPWRELMLRLAGTQTRIDRNLELRKSCRPLPWLSPRWLSRAFFATPPLEVRVAIALASLGAGTEYPAVCNAFGVTAASSRRFFFTEARPARVVWHDGQPLVAILDLVQRRLIDSKVGDLSLLDARVRLSASDVTAFLMGSDSVTIEGVQRWLPAMTLLDWSRKWHQWQPGRRPACEEPLLLLWSFFKPFFTTDRIKLSGRNFFKEGEARASFASQLFSLLRHGSADEGITLALAGYRAQGLRPIRPAVPLRLDHGRLAAALALSISAPNLANLVKRWLDLPNSKSGEGR
jgi:CRISPR-associated protein Csx17